MEMLDVLNNFYGKLECRPWGGQLEVSRDLSVEFKDG